MTDEINQGTGMTHMENGPFPLQPLPVSLGKNGYERFYKEISGNTAIVSGLFDEKEMNLKSAAMKRIFMLACGLALMLCLTACGVDNGRRQTENFKEIAAPDEPEDSGQTAADRQINIITTEGNEIIFQLNDSPAAKDLYEQLPLSVNVDDYAGSEKIFYPPEELDTRDTPMAEGPAGTLAYYAPWGNVAIYCEECGGADGLYGLGEVLSGTEFLAGVTGEIQIRTLDEPSPLGEPAEYESSSERQSLTAPVEESPAVPEPASEINTEENETTKMNVQAGESIFTATLEENEAVNAFVKRMEEAPVVVQMSDYSGFEKVGSLGTGLPSDDSQTTTQSGDIVLYNGNQIVIFYGPNSWSYTRLGKIDDLTGWEDALGSGDITVTFSVK